MRNTLLITNANIFTPVGCAARRGAEMGQLTNIPDGEIEVADGRFVYVGPRRARRPAVESTIDARGRAVLPGFVDSHTHAVFGGYRPDEFGWRMRGDSYMSIMERGGGIASTVTATKEASEDELVAKTRRYLQFMRTMGVTTVEVKSGYGLDFDTEMKQLRAIHRLAAENLGINIAITFLGAHAMPADFPGDHDEYITYIIERVLPEVKRENLAEFCDIFCEKGVFTVDQSRRLLLAAQEMGLKSRIHADEIVCTDGAVLAAEIGALSADHLLHISDEGIRALAASSTIATLLPLTAFTLREPYAPGRRLIDAGAAVALATDFNPGSCFSCSVPLMIALACIYMHMSVEETITALTINGAAALGRSADTGTIEVGKRADLVMLDYDNIAFLPYFTGLNCVAATICGGEVTYTDPNHLNHKLL